MDFNKNIKLYEGLSDIDDSEDIVLTKSAIDFNKSNDTYNNIVINDISEPKLFKKILNSIVLGVNLSGYNFNNINSYPCLSKDYGITSANSLNSKLKALGWLECLCSWTDLCNFFNVKYCFNVNDAEAYRLADEYRDCVHLFNFSKDSVERELDRCKHILSKDEIDKIFKKIFDNFLKDISETDYRYFNRITRKYDTINLKYKNAYICNLVVSPDKSILNYIFYNYDKTFIESNDLNIFALSYLGDNEQLVKILHEKPNKQLKKEEELFKRNIKENLEQNEHFCNKIPKMPADFYLEKIDGRNVLMFKQETFVNLNRIYHYTWLTIIGALSINYGVKKYLETFIPKSTYYIKSKLLADKLKYDVDNCEYTPYCIKGNFEAEYLYALYFINHSVVLIIYDNTDEYYISRLDVWSNHDFCITTKWEGDYY